MIKRKQTIVAMLGLVLLLTIAMLPLAGCSDANAHSDENASSGSQEQSSETDAASNEVPEWTYEADCMLCHADEAGSFDDSSCTANMHADVQCATCHADEAGLKAAHEDVTRADTEGTKHLKATEVNADQCISCHGDVTELAQQTVDSTALTDSEGAVVNPHAMPATKGHTDAETNCADCHTLHSAETAVESAESYCASCHHAGVYQCYTCHE